MYPYRFKKGIPDSQTLHHNRICSDSISFDRRCNDLGRWLLERAYKEKVVWKQVLRDRAICRDDLLNRERTLQEKAHATFNLTYYSVFKNVRKILTPFTYTRPKLITRFSQKYLLLVLKKPRVLRNT